MTEKLVGGRFVSTYGFVPSDLRMVFYVTNDILPPNDWVVIIGLELVGDELCPGIHCLQPLLTEHIGQMALNHKGRHGANAVANDSEQRESLIY